MNNAQGKEDDGMSVIETNTDYMKRDVENIETYISELVKAADEMEATIKSLHSSWEGDAATAFESSLTDELYIFRQVIETLKHMNSNTGSAGEKYEKCETEVADIISAIKM